MNSLANYVTLSQLQTKYAVRMQRLSNKIFGEVTRPTNYQSMKVVKFMSENPVNKREEVRYYPRLKETHYLMEKLRLYGLYRDEHADFNDEIKRQRKLKGKKVWICYRFYKEMQKEQNQKS